MPNPLLYEKRFYDRETIKGVRISLLAEIPSSFHDCHRWLNKKRVNYFSCIEGNWTGFDRHLLYYTKCLYCKISYAVQIGLKLDFAKNKLF